MNSVSSPVPLAETQERRPSNCLRRKRDQHVPRGRMLEPSSSLDLLVYERELEVSAGSVFANVCCFDVEPVRAVSVLACVPAAGEPEAVEAGRVGVVLACS